MKVLHQALFLNAHGSKTTKRRTKSYHEWWLDRIKRFCQVYVGRDDSHELSKTVGCGIGRRAFQCNESRHVPWSTHLAWDSVKRIAWRSVKWVLGLIISTIGFIEIASRYEEWKATGWGLSGLPLSSTAWWDIVRIALVVLGVSIILSDIWSQIKLRSASFKTEILDKKSAYQEGDIVQFRAEYTGKLKNGYFLADIIPPSGTVLPDGKQKTQAVDNATWHSPWADHGRMGRIRGTNAPPREWGFQIPAKCPTGKYKVVFEVYDGEFGKAKQLGSGEDFFVVESVADVTRQPDEVNVEKLTDLLNLVYVPLYSAVLEMKEGKATFPHTNLTVGNLQNPWSSNPKIIQQVVDVFEKYSALIENDDVRKGWDRNKDQLREGKFWYGEDTRKWLESIEKEYQNARDTGSRQAVMPRPELFIPLTKLGSTGEVKELEVRFPNGESRRNRVCFYYVPVMAKGQRTVENVYASLDGNPLRIMPKTGKPSFGIDYHRFSVEDFDKVGPREFVYALLREEKKTKDRIEYVHPSQGQDFVLFFGVEGLTDFYIVADTYLWYNPRTGFCGGRRDDGTGTLRLKLDLSGQDAKGCSMMFEVAFRKWDSFTVTPIELPQ